MFIIVFSIILAGIIAVFATENTSVVTLHFGSYVLSSIPMYGVLIGTLLFAFLIAWIFTLLNDMSNGVMLYKKDRSLSQAEKTIVSLKTQVENLKEENQKLQTDKQVIKEEAKAAPLKRPVIENLRRSFS